MVKLIECPRDAMQGMESFIPTAIKVKYLNALLSVGFDTLDFGSFVSPKAIPQMRDTGEVLESLILGNTDTKLLAIVANKRGAEDACQFEQINYLGFPLSLSETFQQRNTNRSIGEAFGVIEQIQGLAVNQRRQLVVYLSMGFGNPYGDQYNPGVIGDFISKLDGLGVGIISLADTVGLARSEDIASVLQAVMARFPKLEIGAHLHATPGDVHDKVMALKEVGCPRIDGALRGFGGCPMAKDDLVGNIPMEQVIELLDEDEISKINGEALKGALLMSGEVFG